MSGAAGDLRKPLFTTAVVMVALIVLTELGLSFAVGGGAVTTDLTDTSLGVPADLVAAGPAADTPSGSGIRYLALLGGLLLFTVLLLGSSVVVSQRAYARVQGLASLVVALAWILMSVLLALAALARLMLMIGLFVSPPFGTLAYLLGWGFFPVGDAAAVLALLPLLKSVFVGFLVASQPRFLQVKGLMPLVALSFGLQVVLGLIHGFLPRVVVSIGAVAWALVTAVVALVWAVVMLVTAVPAIVNAVRVSRSLNA